MLRHGYLRTFKMRLKMGHVHCGDCVQNTRTSEKKKWKMDGMSKFLLVFSIMIIKTVNKTLENKAVPLCLEGLKKTDLTVYTLQFIRAIIVCGSSEGGSTMCPGAILTGPEHLMGAASPASQGESRTLHVHEWTCGMQRSHWWYRCRLHCLWVWRELAHAWG